MKIEDGKWKIEDGELIIEIGKWKIEDEDGEWILPIDKSSNQITFV